MRTAGQRSTGSGASRIPPASPSADTASGAVLDSITTPSGGSPGDGAAGRHDPVRGGQLLLPQGRRDRPSQRRRRGRAHRHVPRAARAGPRATRRRVPGRLRRLPHPAQRGPRAVQGRDPLPPHRQPRRGPGPGQPHDLEDLAGRHPLRRGQGWHRGRPDPHEHVRARAHVTDLLRPDRPHHRPDPRHPGPRRQHQRPGHELVHGRVRAATGSHHPDRHGQAAGPRGLGGARGGHGAGRGHRHGPCRRAARARLSRPAVRGRPGVRQRRVVGGSDRQRSRLPGRGRLGRQRGDPPRGRPRHPHPGRARGRVRHGRRLPGGGAHQQPSSCSSSTSTSWCPPPWARS